MCGGLSLKAVNNWLSTDRPVPASSLEIIRRLMADDEAAEKQRQQSSEPQSHLVIKVDVDEFNAWENIAIRKTPAQTVTEYCLAAIRSAFDEEMGTKLTPVQESQIITFPEVPLLRAAAGFPILADAEMVQPDRKLGPGRFILELRGDSMEPRFKDRQRVILRDKATLKRPVLKYGELYCFVHEGQAAFKQWAKDSSGQKVLRSLNSEHPDIPADDQTDWIGWVRQGG
jgi:SOS-response transcriptional repressor LexA